MNFTLALLGGLVLILPGLSGVVAWHVQSGRHGARRSEMPLTSIVALVLVVGTSLVSHFFGWAILELGLSAFGELVKAGTRPTNPYEVAARLAEGRANGSELPGIVAFICVVSFESVFAWAVVSSRGLSLAIKDFDAGNQGWVFQNIILPTRHGTKPIAFVLTNAQNGSAGLGYRGVVVEARQGPDGDLKGLTLANPEVFVYAVEAPAAPGGRADVDAIRIRRSAKRPLDGVLALEAAAIRNVLVQTIPDRVVDDIVNDVPADGDPAARTNEPAS